MNATRLCRALGPTLVTLTLAGCAGGWRNGAPPGTERAAAPAVAAAPAARPAAAAPATATGGGTRETADGVLFVWTGGGNAVNVAGEFNAWNTGADPMAKQADGSFTLLKNLPPGRYPYKFVIDGGTWKEDPTAREFVDDGFGGKNSVLTVSGAATGAAGAPIVAPAAPAVVPVSGKPSAPVAGPDGVRFTFAGAATSVHLAGDFNGWSTTADPMERQSDGTWTVTKKLPPGSYGYKFVVNGTTWKTDEANPASQDDGFGGKNSVVTVR
jgi:1,4-alpha-glucan branching enzyme